MKTPYKISKELGVSPQAVYKKITDEFNNQFNNHMQKYDNGKLLLDEVAEQALRALFEKTIEPTIEPVVEPTIEPVVQQLLNQKDAEISYLRLRVEVLEAELNTERSHSREMFEQVARIAENQQTLSGMDKTIPLLTDKKKKWFQFWKKNRLPFSERVGAVRSNEVEQPTTKDS
jgi:hypothetical protein